MDDFNCPWCGEIVENPFTGEAITRLNDFDTALEAHVEGCEPWLAEQEAAI